MRFQPVRLGALILALLGCSYAQSTQSKSQPIQSQQSQPQDKGSDYTARKISGDTGFHETAEVCYSTCKYKGDSGTYIGVSSKDDDSCSAACGQALKKCNDSNDTNCSYVEGSCKFTNCPSSSALGARWSAQLLLKP